MNISSVHGYFDLGSNAGIALNIDAPWLNPREIQSGFTYPFSLPSVPANRSALGMVHLAEHLIAPFTIAVVVELNSFTQLPGVLTVIEGNEKEIRCRLQLGLATKVQQMRTLKLNDLVHEIEYSGEFRPYIDITLDVQGATPPDGVTLHLVRDQPNKLDPSKRFFFSATWQGSVAATLQALAERLNRSEPFPLFDITATYNAVRPDIVKQGTSYYECKVNGTTGIPLSNTTHWMLISDPAAVAWTVNALQQFYDHPLWRRDLLALVYGSTLRIIDLSNSSPFELSAADIVQYSTFTNIGNPAYRGEWDLVYDGVPALSRPFFDFQQYLLDRRTGHWPAQTHAYPVVYNEEFSLVGDPLNKHMNYYFLGIDEYPVSQDEVFPFFYIGAVLTWVADALDMQLDVSVFDDSRYDDFKKCILFTNTPFTFRRVRTTTTSVGVTTTYFNIGACLPAITIASFFNQLRSAGVYVIPDNELRKLRLVLLPMVVAKPPDMDITDRVVMRSSVRKINDTAGLRLDYAGKDERYAREQAKADTLINRLPDVATFTDLRYTRDTTLYALVVDENRYYRNVKTGTDDYEWQYYSDNLSAAFAGAAPYTDYPLLHRTLYSHIIEYEWLVPSCKVKVNNSTQEEYSELKDLILLFYRGMQLTTDDLEYPMATSGVRNAKGAVIGELSLIPSEPTYGLYDIVYKGWLQRLLRGASVTYTANLTEDEMNRIEQDTKLRIWNSEYLLQRMKISSKKAGEVQLELWRL